MAEVAQPSTGPGAVCLLTYHEDHKNFYSVGHTANYTKEWRKEKERQKITFVGFVQTKYMEKAEKKAKKALVGGDLKLLEVDLKKLPEGMVWFEDNTKKSPENVLVELVRAVEDVIEWVYVLIRGDLLIPYSILHDRMPPKTKVVYEMPEMVLCDRIHNILFMDMFYETLVKERHASKDEEASGWVYMMECKVMRGIACYTIDCSSQSPETKTLKEIQKEERNNNIELVFAVYDMGHALNAFETALENAGYKKIQRQEGEREWYIEIEQA